MFGDVLTGLVELVDHPKVAVIGFLFAIAATFVGYAWASQAHEDLKTNIVTEVADTMTLRDIKQAEQNIARLTTRINLHRCGNPECDIEKAERENLRDYIKSLREDLAL